MIAAAARPDTLHAELGLRQRQSDRQSAQRSKEAKKLRVARSGLLELDWPTADRMRTSQTAKTLGPLKSSASTAHPCSIWSPASPSIEHYCAPCCLGAACRVHGRRMSSTTALRRACHLPVHSICQPDAALLAAFHLIRPQPRQGRAGARVEDPPAPLHMPMRAVGPKVFG